MDPGDTNRHVVGVNNRSVLTTLAVSKEDVTIHFSTNGAPLLERGRPLGSVQDRHSLDVSTGLEKPWNIQPFSVASVESFTGSTT